MYSLVWHMALFLLLETHMSRNPNHLPQIIDFITRVMKEKLAALISKVPGWHYINASDLMTSCCGVSFNIDCQKQDSI